MYTSISFQIPPPPTTPWNIGSFICPVFWNSSDFFGVVSFHQLFWVLRGSVNYKLMPFTYWLFSYNILDFFSVIVTVISGTPIDSSIFENFSLYFLSPFLTFGKFPQFYIIIFLNWVWGSNRSCFVLVLFLKCMAWPAELCMVQALALFSSLISFPSFSLLQSQWFSRVLNSHVTSCWRTFACNIEFVPIWFYLLNSYLFFSLQLNGHIIRIAFPGH